MKNRVGLGAPGRVIQAMTTVPNPALQTLPFTEYLGIVQRRVRDALGGLLEALGADPRKPQDLARKFGMNSTTAWKLCKVVREGDPQVFVEHLPGPSGTKSLLRLARKENAPEAAIRCVEEAMAEFDHMVELHAGDRPTLERMAASQSSRALQRQREAHRKLSFRGNSCTWGVQAELQLMASFIAPSATPGLTDLAKVTGLLGFCRLRPDAVWPMATTGTWNRELDVDSSEAPLAEAPLDEAFAREHGMPLLSEFSTQPAPALNIKKAGTLRVLELSEGLVGMTGSISCLFGLQTREFGPLYFSEENQHSRYYTLLSTPVEAAVVDLFIHRDMRTDEAVQTVLRTRMESAGIADGRFAGAVLPMDEPLIHLGSPPDVTIPEFPRYGRMVDFVCERLGRDASEFDGYRIRMTYPAIPTTLEFRHGMPERPAK